MDAEFGMERKVSRHRQWRFRWIDLSTGAGCGGCAWLRSRLDRHRSHQLGCELGAWTSREDCRLRASCRARDDRESQVDHQCVLRQWPEAFLLRQLLERRTTGADGSAALSE